MSSNSSSILLSEGTCYFGAGQVADNHFIPCGNAAISGPQTCCYAGDYCLSSNACFDSATVVTYIAGCTDSLFRASACPQRNNYPDQQWVALARCDGANIDIWTGCARHPEQIQLEKENCNCNMSEQLIQNPNGKGSLDEIGQLPNRTGQAVAFNPTYVPTVLSTSAPGSGGLSTGAKAGIGVGVTIAGLFLIAGAALFFLRRRKSKQIADPEVSQLSGNNFHRQKQLEIGGNEKVELAGDGKVELAGESERGFSVEKSGGEATELDSNGSVAIGHTSTDISELDASSPRTTGISPASK